MILKIFGVYASDGRVRWNPKVALVAVVVTLSPIVLALVLLWTSPSPVTGVGPHLFWICYFVALIYVAAGLAYGGVAVFHGLTEPLEEVLTEDGLDAYARWSDVATAYLPQALSGCLVAAAAVVALWMGELTGALGALYVSPASYLSLLVSGFFIGCAGYWVFAGSVLSIPITKFGRMKVSPYAPLSTPGIELLVRCYRLAFYGASVGVSICLFPILQWSAGGAASQSFTIVKFSLFAFSLAAVAAISLVPQWRLTRLLSQQRRDTFNLIVAQLPADPSRCGEGLNASDAYLLTWLQTLSSSKVSTVSESAFTGILLGLATALVPLAIQMVLK
ncbi:MAG: hypothetical protein KJ817_11865 [Actinobacteria bacterium]|nr:hypothetical protein [Actinomycetota bacterium]